MFNTKALSKRLHVIETKLATVDALLDYKGWQCLEKSDGAVLNATIDPLFTITGGPVVAKIYGVVTTVIGGAANGTLQHTPVSPTSTTVSLSTTVPITSDAVGTSYRFVSVAAGTVPILTPTTNGATWINCVTAEQNDSEFFLPIGTLGLLGSAAQTGVIKWYINYRPLSPNSVVTVAA